MNSLNYIYEIIQKGGPVMWPLLLCSLTSITIAIERIIFLGYNEFKKNKKLINELLAFTEEGQFEKAINAGENSHDPAVKVMVAGLIHRKHGLSDAMQMAAEKEVDRMKQGISVLDTVITMAPLLGILGTVTGIIASFSLMNDSGLQDPKLAMGGLSEALITTATGLTIALMTLIPFNYLTGKVQKIARRIEHSATHVEVAYRHSQ